jgi:hypothetical protein
MAGFNTKTFSTHDDYMTPFKAWENIREYIPNNKIIWEAFYGDGTSGQYLRDLGFEVIHENIDFFENDKGDIIISNPPFTKSKEILNRLKELNKPFILILPSPKLFTKYIRELFSDCDERLQIIIPRKRIQFNKLVNNKIELSNKCNFDCFYYCWKINLENDIIWLK